jgi:flagellar biosynthesis chaperone FliJ
MQQTMRKMKRVEPLIRLKQGKVDEEAGVLGVIRSEKVAVVKSMRDNQKRYMDGVEQLNKLRASRARQNLETLESALDHVKAQWYRLYKQVQEVEAREKTQIGRVLAAERDLKAVEKLHEKYELELKQELGRIEQKQLDEFALRRLALR